MAQKAHIYAFSAAGPRGKQDIQPELLNKFENLILVCPTCHLLIDRNPDRYTAAIVQQWKTAHELRVEVVTGIDPRKNSHVVLYGANVGDHSSPLNFSEAAHALFPTLYPAADIPITLGTINSSFDDRNPSFWQIESENLATQFQRHIKGRLALGDIDHLSIFAIGPQPLLIQLGTHLIDITNAEVFQRHREPQTWAWPAPASHPDFQVQEPSSCEGTPALVLALSAPVTDDRITAVLGAHASIWRVTVASPNNDLIKSRAQLSEFRILIRELLDRIKARHGQTTTLHIFPAAGISPAIELGRVRMPKAHMPWQLYDQVNARGGFIPAISFTTGA